MAAPAWAVEDDYAGGVFGETYAFQAARFNFATSTPLAPDNALGVAGTSSETPNSANFNATATGGFLTLQALNSPLTAPTAAVTSITATPLSGGTPIVFTDTYVSALVNVDTTPASDSDIGLFLRSNGANGYLLSFDLDDGTLDLAEVTGGAAVTLDSIVFGAGYNPSEDYFLEFSAQGTTLTGRLLDEAGGTLLRSLTVNDATYAAGFAGVFAAFNNDFQSMGGAAPALGTFDNLVIAVPEPASLGLLALGSVALLRRRR